jgi:S-adenosylmethionine/arginine decarboxylase-like enzyme
MAQGREWIIDAFECAPARITGETGREALTSLFANVIRSAGLHPVGQAVWQLTGTAGAVTGLVALVESHLTCHSDPPSAFLSLNLLSNRVELAPDWEGLLTRFVGARRIEVRIVERGEATSNGTAPQPTASVSAQQG